MREMRLCWRRRRCTEEPHPHFLVQVNNAFPHGCVPSCMHPSTVCQSGGGRQGSRRRVEVWHTALQARRTMTCCDRSATTTKPTCSSCASRQYRPRHSPAIKRNGSLSFVRLTTRQTRRLSCSAPRPISGKTQSLQRQNNVPAVFDDAVRAVLSSAPQAVTKMAKAMMSTR